MSFSERIVRVTLATSAAGIIAFAAMHARSVKVQAHEHDSDDDLVEIGLRIAPDFLNMTGKDPKLVGLGSFIVNAQADCNGCHGSDPANEYLPAYNPYFLPLNPEKPRKYRPAKYNQTTYLNGGQNFGSVGPGIVQDPNSPLFGGAGLGPTIISRNLTPDKTGNPEGGNDLRRFIKIMRTGRDFDKLHLNCSGDVTDNCYLPPVDGSRLQVMPWPLYRHMTDHQLEAIWTYLSTVPCNAHNDALGNTYPWLKNDCN
ncbi:MAG TPA: hypothetical protein VEI01_19905 [Terriglobales bacterium]|nr:hypothetical protein [Terriglobales bacterium]